MDVSAISASNASFFPEYVLPNVKYLTRDPDVMVRVVFAQCIVPLAETAIQFLEMSQAVKAHGTVKSKEAKELNATFEEVNSSGLSYVVDILFDDCFRPRCRSRTTSGCEIYSLRSKSRSSSFWSISDLLLSVQFYRIRQVFASSSVDKRPMMCCLAT